MELLRKAVQAHRAYTDRVSQHPPSLLPWPWVEPEEPVRGKTGRRAGCGPSVQGPGPPGGPRGDSL